MRDGWAEVRLGDVLVLDNSKLGEHDEEPVVFSLSKYDGVVLADDYFDKRIASDKLDGYKVLGPGGWAYSTIHIDEGSIATNHHGLTGVLSPMYTTMRWVGQDDDPRYFELLLRTPRMLTVYRDHAAGTVNRRRSLAYKAFAELRVDVPPLVVQRRVVDLVDAVDAYAAAAQAGRLGVERAYLAVLVEQYGDLLATAPAEAFAAVAQSRLGKMLSKASKTGAAEHPYLRNANVQWDELRLDDLNTMSFSKSEQAEFSLRAGDLLVCEGGEVGRAALVVEDLPQVFFQKALHRVRCGDRLLPRFLLHYLRYCAETGGFRDLATAMTIQHLTGEKLKTLPVPVPPLDQQQALVDVLDASLQLGHRSDHVVETVMALRSALLGELLSGDREVPESYDDLVGVA